MFEKANCKKGTRNCNVFNALSSSTFATDRRELSKAKPYKCTAQAKVYKRAFAFSTTLSASALRCLYYFLIIRCVYEVSLSVIIMVYIPGTRCCTDISPAP